MDVMLDIETLSKDHNAVILTLGAVRFNPYTNGVIAAKLYMRPDVDEQVEMGRHIDESTVEWWSTQAADVQEEAFTSDGRIPIEEFCANLNKFMVGVTNIWSQGPMFDMTIIENLYKQINKPTPWNFWQISDSRTLFKAHGDPRVKGKAGLHNALEDCISQANAVQTIYKQLELKPRFS
jgi:hypothetical protein